jgi:hypothetical protein
VALRIAANAPGSTLAIVEPAEIRMLAALVIVYRILSIVSGEKGREAAQVNRELSESLGLSLTPQAHPDTAIAILTPIEEDDTPFFQDPLDRQQVRRRHIRGTPCRAGRWVSRTVLGTPNKM